MVPRVPGGHQEEAIVAEGVSGAVTLAPPPRRVVTALRIFNRGPFFTPSPSPLNNQVRFSLKAVPIVGFRVN